MARAAAARSAAERLVSNEAARVSRARARVAEARARFAQLREVTADAARRRLDREQRYIEAVRKPASQAEADALLSEFTGDFVRAQGAFDRALDALNAPPSFDTELEPPALESVEGYGEARERLRAEYAAVRLEQAHLVEEEQAFRLKHARELAAELWTLLDARDGLLGLASPERRRAIRGWTREAASMAALEMRHLSHGARWYPTWQLYRFKASDDSFEALVQFGSLSWTALKLLALVLAFFFFVRRRQGTVAQLNDLTAQRPRSALSLALRWLGRTLGPLSTELAFVAFTLLLRHQVFSGARLAEVDVATELLVAIAWYRFALALAIRIARGDRRTAAELARRIERLIRRLGRLAIVIVVGRMILQRAVGRGALHALFTDGAMLVVVGTAISVLHAWRGDIAAAYLRLQPDGALPRWVRETSERRIGLAVVLLAFFVVAGAAFGRWLRSIVLGFEQTRRALAYVFRLRLERQAEERGYAPEDVHALPDALRSACAGTPDDTPVLPAEHLGPVIERVAAWHAGGMPRAMALVGDEGVGKTTWLRMLGEGVEQQCPELAQIVLRWEPRITSAQDLLVALAAALHIELEPAATPELTLERLADAIHAAPRRLVLCDGCEHLLLRAMGGFGALRAFIDVVGRTSDHLFWVCSFHGPAWRLVESVVRGRDAFGDVVRLEGWSERRLGNLIEVRTAAGGVQVDFGAIRGAALDGPETLGESLDVSERFYRLLWDHADGNPRVALHVWLRSLAPSSTPGTLEVRLFRAPGADALERLADLSRFCLAAVVTHRSITAAELARCLGEPYAACDATLRRMAVDGVLRERAGRYRVAVRWQPAVERFLRRKHLMR